MAADDVVADVRDGRYRPFYWIDNALNTEYAPRIHASGLAVYGVLAMHARASGLCTLSLDTIARQAGLRDRDTAAAALEKLAAERLITIERGRGRRSVYRLLDIYQAGTETLRPRRPSARAGDGSTTDEEPNLPKKPATPAQKTRNFEPNLPKKPAPTIDTIDNRQSRRIEIDDDDVRAREAASSSSSSSSAPLPASSSLASSSAPAPASSSSTPETWDDLTALYGLDAVQHARRVAANPAKKNDFAYIRGVLKRLARRGPAPTGSGVFGERGAESKEIADCRLQIADVDAVDAADIDATPVDPVWGEAVEGLRQAVTRGTFDAYVRDARLVGLDGDALVVEVRTAGARDWMKARLAGRVREAWTAAGGAAVNRVQFVTEGER